MTCPQMGCWLAKHGCDTKLYCAPSSQFFAILTSSSMAVARASRWGRWGSRRGRRWCWGRGAGGRRSSWFSFSGQRLPLLLKRLCLPGKSLLDWHRPLHRRRILNILYLSTRTQTHSIFFSYHFFWKEGVQILPLKWTHWNRLKMCSFLVRTLDNPHLSIKSIYLNRFVGNTLSHENKSTSATKIQALFVVDKYKVGSSAVDQRDCVYFIYAAN